MYAEGSIKQYLISKLSDINYRIAIHEGDANRRLASEANAILALPPHLIAVQYQTEFNKLHHLIVDAYKQMPEPYLHPYRFRRIQNRTAAKYIKLLIDLEAYFKDANPT